MSEKRTDPNVAKVRELLLARSALGIKKYGCTTVNLSPRQAMIHLREELMDAAVYLTAAIGDGCKQEPKPIEANNPAPPTPLDIQVAIDALMRAAERADTARKFQYAKVAGWLARRTPDAEKRRAQRLAKVLAGASAQDCVLSEADALFVLRGIDEAADGTP